MTQHPALRVHSKPGARKHKTAGVLLGSVGLAALCAGSAQAQEPITLAPVEVFATSPLGSGQNLLDIPSETQAVDSQEIQNINQPNIQDVLARRAPGVSVTDEIGSPLAQSVDFRGETASPVPGTPQGLAVYMNGVRINEAYGDIVNWDLIPPMAIERAEVVTGNPVFGLNALAGAVVMNMKDGFTWQGTEVDLQGGTDYTAEGTLQYGMKKDNWAFYVAMDGYRTNGYRYFGQSDVERGYADLGYRAEGNDMHLSITGAADGLGVAGTTPLGLIAQQGYASVFTTPQTTDTSAEMVTLRDQSQINPTLKFDGDIYFRNYAQSHVDGNVSNYSHCAAGAGFLCNSGAVTGVVDPDPTQPDGQPTGEIDYNWTQTKTIGTTLQLTNTDKIFDHNNTITAGVSVDHGWTHFEGISQLGTLPSDLVVAGYPGAFIDDPSNDISPVNLDAQNTYIGIYVLDDFAITDRFSVHAGARFNDAFIDLTDLTGANPTLNSNNNFNRINPVVGATFKITPDIAVYASYSEANRAPTPLELGCSNPSNPCMIDNFLVSDPPLKQIVARTVEAGFKGNNTITEAMFPVPGNLSWSINFYHTENQNDIYNVPSPTVIGLGYYTNAGDTLRQGVDVGATYTTEKWDVYANYSYIQAQFLTPVLLSSPNNPNADANGNIQVMPGDNIPGIPNHKIKVGFDYTVLPKWKIGADVVYRSGIYYFGDEINSLPQIAGFATVNLRTSYQINDHFQVFGQINNALDYRGGTYGTLYDTGSTVNQVTGAPVAGLFSSTDPRAITITPPLEVLAGARMTF